jgi:hypothetical protein
VLAQRAQKADRMSTLRAVLAACAQLEINQPSSPEKENERAWREYLTSASPAEGWSHLLNKCGARAFSKSQADTVSTILGEEEQWPPQVAATATIHLHRKGKTSKLGWIIYGLKKGTGYYLGRRSPREK